MTVTEILGAKASTTEISNAEISAAENFSTEMTAAEILHLSTILKTRGKEFPL